jgi:DNA-binding NarL/FixJ family response regulator
MDVVIVDLCPRNRDGLNLIRELRDTYPGAMVLALTISRDPEHCARAVRAGASVVVNKEATLDEILRVTRGLSARTAHNLTRNFPDQTGLWSRDGGTPLPVSLHRGQGRNGNQERIGK